MYEVDEYTVSLLHFDDGIKDETGKVWTANGNPVVSAAQSKFGEKSLYLDGSSYLTSTDFNDFDIRTGNWTVDWWEYRTNHVDYACVLNIGIDVYNEADKRFMTFGNPSNTHIMRFLASTNGTSTDIVMPLGTVTLNTWTHYAIVRDGSILYGFKNGVLISTANITTSFVVDVDIIRLGQTYGSYTFNGYIDEFRFSKGVARWTGDFNPELTLAATAGDSRVTLSWTAVNEATSYNVKRSTTAGGTYTTIASNVTGTSYVDTSVTNGTTYYYVVTALNADGESKNSNEASATPEGIVLLRITMNDSSEREYQVTSSEADKFIAWCNRTVDTGNAYYIFNKVVGSQTSKEYLFFEKIISFEVFKI